MNKEKGRTPVYLGVGGNVGAVEENLRQLFVRLQKVVGLHALRASSFYRGTPTGPIQDQPDFTNAVFECWVDDLKASSFLQQMQGLELSFGRVRTIEQGPRTMDIDLLLWGDEKINLPTLQIPHSRMYERKFVLKPLAELLGADYVLPSGKSIEVHLQELGSQHLRRLGKL